MRIKPLNQVPPAELRTAMLAAGPACRLDQAHLFTAPDAFEVEEENARRRRERRAKKICATCPAIAECLAYALAIRPSDGVWAGKTATAVRALSLQLVSDDKQEAA
ncbi:WhiB family transcriptional regulator [Streptomyces anulatus]|uniref:WhiB family transcriptional regulator n=1 Tax=Streptomyces anulatus TaxID=1892 RepID=UPI00342107D8